MAKTKYGKYVITQFEPGFKVDRGKPPLLWLGDDLIKGAIHFECVWFFPKPPEEKLDPKHEAPPHTHDFDEIIGFIGTNPRDQRDLGAQLEIWLEDEKHIIDKSCIIYIPKGMKHCPLKTTGQKYPIFHFVIGTTDKYDMEAK
jgi:hypothetical protein